MSCQGVSYDAATTRSGEAGTSMSPYAEATVRTSVGSESADDEEQPVTTIAPTTTTAAAAMTLEPKENDRIARTQNSYRGDCLANPKFILWHDTSPIEAL
jgi:hypothetical protein